MYRDQGMSLHPKRPKPNKAAQLRQPKTLAQRISQIWSMDSCENNLYDGRRLRIRTVVDCNSRESLAIHVGHSLQGKDVVRGFDQIVQERGRPETITTDNGNGFISKVMDNWLYERGVEIDSCRPGNPTDNAMVERFNGRLRQECRNEHWIMSLNDAQTKIEIGRLHDIESGPHRAQDW